MTPDEALSKNIRLLMVAVDCEAADIAAALGVGPNAIYKRLRGELRWSLDDLAALARMFGVSADQLLSDPANLLTVTPTYAPQITIPYSLSRGPFGLTGLRPAA